MSVNRLKSAGTDVDPSVLFAINNVLPCKCQYLPDYLTHINKNCWSLDALHVKLAAGRAQSEMRSQALSVSKYYFWISSHT